MELRNLNTFIQVVESGSFTKAAEVLGYTQSTVSFQISQLEAELNCRLFERVGRSNELTSRGQLLLQHALGIQHSMQDLVETFHDEETPSGTVHLYSSDSICEKMMMLNYSEFYRTYPNIRLIFSTGSTTDLLKVLEHNEADIIFTLDNHVFRQDCTIARESPVSLKFMTSPSNPLAGRDDLTIHDILKYPLLLTEKGLSYRKIFDDHCATLSVEAQPVLETARTDILIRSVAQGIGITYLPEFIGHAYAEAGAIVYLEVKDFDLTIWKQLIHRKDKWISRSLASFMDFVIEHEFKW